METKKRNLVHSASIILLTLTVLGGAYYFTTYKCLELREGTVSAKLRYSEEFFFHDPVNYNISIYRDADLGHNGVNLGHNGDIMGSATI